MAGGTQAHDVMSLYILVNGERIMKSRKTIKLPPKALLPSARNPHESITVAGQPAGNASQPMEKLHVRRKAGADQAILQEKGSDALPVSDYPLKTGPITENNIDRRERKRLNSGG